MTHYLSSEPFRFQYLAFTDFAIPEQHFQNCFSETSAFRHTSQYAETAMIAP